MQNLTVGLRNIVLLSHGGAGKTSLAESLLLATGAITRMGRIEDGNTASDYEAEEVKRGNSTQMSLIPCLWNDYKINFIDTPGYADFLGEVVAALRVADGGVVVVAAPSRIEVGTEQVWDLLDKQSAPRVVLVNKMDRENADFLRTVDALQARFGRACVATHVPIGAEADFKGVVSLLSADQDYPPEMAEVVEAARERLTEAVAESDDDLATKFLEGESITEAELKEALSKGVASGQIVPVLPGSATSGVGIQELLEVVIDFMPSPDKAAGQQEESLQPEPGGNLAALIFKTSADPYVGKISYFRVYSGTFKSDSQIWNSDKGQAERVGQLFIFRGKNQEQISEVTAGDIGAVTKLSVTTTGDTLCQKETPLVLPGIPSQRHTTPWLFTPRASRTWTRCPPPWPALPKKTLA